MVIISPPWVGTYVCANMSAIVRETAERMRGDRRCSRLLRQPWRVATPRGQRPPLLAWVRYVGRRKQDFLRCTNAHPRERRALPRLGWDKTDVLGHRAPLRLRTRIAAHGCHAPAVLGCVRGGGYDCAVLETAKMAARPSDERRHARARLDTRQPTRVERSPDERNGDMPPLVYCVCRHSWASVFVRVI